MKSNVTTMNKFFTKTALMLVAMTLCGQLCAQMTTTFAKNASPGQQMGLYYSLPQTMLKLDFVIDEVELEKGPLSDYAPNYLAMEDYVDYESTEYRLVDVKMSTVATPDPNATFFVTFASGRGSSKTQFEVMPNGIIRGIGTGNTVDNENNTILHFDGSKPCCQPDEAQNDAFLPLMTAGKTNAQLAKDVADKIEDIRKAKYYLISGDVEMASNPETFNAMCQQLDAMEQEYLSLLIGKRVVKRSVQTVYVVPNKEVTTQSVAKFSETDGLTVGTNGSGNTIIVQTQSMNTTATINAPSQSAVESMNYENKVFYRIPETANVKVTCGNRTLLEDRLNINQLGALLMAPIANTKLVFDTETGQIINMKMQ